MSIQTRLKNLMRCFVQKFYDFLLSCSTLTTVKTMTRISYRPLRCHLSLFCLRDGLYTSIWTTKNYELGSPTAPCASIFHYFVYLMDYASIWTGANRVNLALWFLIQHIIFVQNQNPLHLSLTQFNSCLAF